jgi:hypothetical protein
MSPGRVSTSASPSVASGLPEKDTGGDTSAKALPAPLSPTIPRSSTPARRTRYVPFSRPLSCGRGSVALLNRTDLIGRWNSGSSWVVSSTSVSVVPGAGVYSSATGSSTNTTAGMATVHVGAAGSLVGASGLAPFFTRVP